MSRILSHLSFLKKLSSTHTHPLISICEFLKPQKLLFLEFESFVKVECELEKKSLNNFICHLSFPKKHFPIQTHPLISIHEFLKLFDWLFLEFESFIKGWMWIGKKITNNFICHLSFLKKLSPTHTHPLLSIHELLNPYVWLFLFWVWIIHKRLNVYWKKNHSIILSLTCHSLRNFPLFIHIPSYPFVNFLNPTIDYFLSLNHS